MTVSKILKTSIALTMMLVLVISLVVGPGVAYAQDAAPAEDAAEETAEEAAPEPATDPDPEAALADDATPTDEATLTEEPALADDATPPAEAVPTEENLTIKLNVERADPTAASFNVASEANFSVTFRVENNNTSGDAVRKNYYDYSLTNPGLTFVPAGSSLTSGSDSLAPGTSTTYIYNFTAPTGPATGTITLSASLTSIVPDRTWPSGGDKTSDSMSYNVTVLAPLGADTTPPTLHLPDDMTVEATGPSGAVVTFSATADDADPVHPAVSCLPVSDSTFALGTTPVNCSATDTAGNTANGSFNVTVQDTTPPVIAAHADVTAEATSAAGAIVSYTAPATSDNVDPAGVATCDPASGTQFAFGDTTVTCNATDVAGNHAIQTTFVMHVVDTTAPNLVGMPTDMSVEGNTTGGANVSWTDPTATDLVDPTPIVACLPVSGSFFALGGPHAVTCTATDASGNQSSASFNVTVQDTTPPDISFVNRTPATNSNGWNNTDVTVNWSCSDLVGVVSASVSETVSTEGEGQSAIGTCTDTSGNTASDTQTGINIDKTRPSVSVTGVANGATYSRGLVPAAGCDTTDGLSGVATPASVLVDGGNLNGVGTFTATCSGALDYADNAAAPVSVIYYVVYNWNGFFSPVDNPGVVNVAKGGSTIPVKWSLNGVSALSSKLSMTSGPVVCETLGNAVDTIEVSSTGGTSFRYDAAADQFIFNWATLKGWVNTCRQIIVMLDDGTQRFAYFKFK